MKNRQQKKKLILITCFWKCRIHRKVKDVRGQKGIKKRSLKDEEVQMVVITEESNLSVEGVDIPLRYLTISSGSGFSCEAGSCGLCCIAESYTKGIPYKELSRCSEFNLNTKKCRSYPRRLDQCKIYPFMHGTTKDSYLLISPNFNCPHISNDERHFGISEFKEMIIENNLDKPILADYNDDLKRYSLLEMTLDQPLPTNFRGYYFPPNLDQVQQVLKKSLKGILENPVENFKKFFINFSLGVFSLCEYIPESDKDKMLKEIRNLKKSKIPQVNLSECIKSIGKKAEFYIQPSDTKNPSIMSYSATNTKLKMKNITTGKEWIINIQDCEKQFNLTSEGRALLKDYLDLIVKRDYFVGCNKGLFNPEFLGANLPPFINFKGWLIRLIEVVICGMSILSRRDKTNIVDEPLIRESISFTDSRFHMQGLKRSI